LHVVKRLLRSHMEIERTCTKCDKKQPIECYSKRSTKSNTYRTNCKTCQKAFGRAHYKKYKGTYLTRAEGKRLAYAKLIEEYRRHNPCKCGEARWYVLDFHHRDPNEKSFAVGTGVHNLGYSIDKVKQEMRKCDVVCASCHRKRHWDEENQRRQKWG